MEELAAFAVEEAERYARGGVDGLILENHGEGVWWTPVAERKVRAFMEVVRKLR